MTARPDGADDDVDELIGRLPTTAPERTGPSGVLVLRDHDGARQWIIGIGEVPGVGSGPPRVLRDRRLRPADAVVTGTPAALVALLRGGTVAAALPDGVTVQGDRALLDALIEAVGD